MIDWFDWIPRVRRGITVIYVTVKNESGEVIERRVIRPFR